MLQIKLSNKDTELVSSVDWYFSKTIIGVSPWIFRFGSYLVNLYVQYDKVKKAKQSICYIHYTVWYLATFYLLGLFSFSFVYLQVLKCILWKRIIPVNESKHGGSMIKRSKNNFLVLITLCFYYRWVMLVRSWKSSHSLHHPGKDKN